MDFRRPIATALACLAVAIALGQAAPAAEPYRWTNVRIDGGGFVTGIVYHPAERGLVYARTDIGGIYRWDCGQGAWAPLLDQVGHDDAHLHGALSLALDPGDPDRVYVAAGLYLGDWAENAAILRSDDRGRNWTQVKLPFKLGGNEPGRGTGERLQVDPHDGNILFLGTNRDGLWKSADRGGHWAQVAGFPEPGATLVLFDGRSGAAGNATPVLYAGTAGGGLLRSDDGGRRWAAVPGQVPGWVPHHAAIDRDGTLYVAYAAGLGPGGVEAGGVWKGDGAGNWTDITPLKPGAEGAFDKFGYAGLDLDRQHPGTLVVSTVDRWAGGDDLFRSTDGGRHWTGLGAAATHDFAGAPWARAMVQGKRNMGHWIATVAIDPFDGDDAIYVTGYGLWRSADLTRADRGQGTAWTFADHGLEETAVLELASPPSAAPLVSALYDIGGFRHDDPARADQGEFRPFGGSNFGLDYAAAVPGLFVRTVSAPDGLGGYRSTDGGRSWSALAGVPAAGGAATGGRIALSADGTHLLWVPRHAPPFVSADGGTHWAAAAGPFRPADSLIPAADRVDPRRFYVEDRTTGALYASTDGGLSFAEGATVPGGGERERGVLRLAPGHEGDLWVPVKDGLLRSTDGAAHLGRVATVDAAWVVGFGKAAPGAHYPAIYLWGVAGGVEGLFRSDDEGRHWQRINDDRHRYGEISVIEGDGSVFGRVYVGTNGRGILAGDINH